MTLERLLDKGLLERVEPDADRASAMLEEARSHLASAVKIAAEDSNGAYQLLYDAARKAIAAHMAANGLRVTKGRPGAHETTGRYARDQIGGGDAVGQFDRMRRTRNRSEYEVRTFGEAEVTTDLRHAKAIVDAVDEALTVRKSTL